MSATDSNGGSVGVLAARRPPALERLYALSKRGARRSLEAMREACAKDGDPQNRFAAVHIAGTNGKGSVSASLESIARAAGLRTGLYTSPHLQRFAERIRLDGVPISDDVLARHLGDALDRHPGLTFFEVATMAAFHVFAEANVDLAIVEVGLGGRLDATNVLDHPRATAITTIAIDHTEWLGDTLEAIAGEKAAIQKPGVPVITGRLPDEAAAVTRTYAQEVGAGPMWRVGHELVPTFDGGLHLAGPDGHAVTVSPALRGVHQHDNTAIAVGLAWTLGFDDAAITRGIANVSWPGRLETVVATDGAYLLDGAHNDEGVRALAAELDRFAQKRVLVFGAMGDKAWRSMAHELSPRFSARVYVAPSASGAGRSAADPTALIALDPEGVVAESVPEALARARALAGHEGLVVVAGSLYLVGEARAFLRGEPRDPQVGL